MKYKILALGLVMAVVAVMVIPIAVSAAGSPVTTPVIISGSLTATDEPVITTPVYAHATSVSGTSVPSANISLTVNSGTPYTTTASVGGSWTISSISPALSAGDTISVTAQKDPNGVSDPPTTTTVTATSATLTVPGGFAWDGTFQVADNTGYAHSTGSVISVGETWTLTVVDANGGTGTGHMMKSTTPLTNAIQVDKAAISSDTPADTILNYNNEFPGISNYGLADVTWNFPLYVRQRVVSTDVAGTYSITLNYILTPGY